MLENYRTNLIWNCCVNAPMLFRGLRRAGFFGGWAWNQRARIERATILVLPHLARAIRGLAGLRKSLR